jgi:hypothetical protein
MISSPGILHTSFKLWLHPILSLAAKERYFTTNGFQNMDANLTTDFDLISEFSAQGRYDYIIVGSGLGGGILTRKLVEGKNDFSWSKRAD